MTAPLLDYYLTYAFLKRLALPFEHWPAFKRGVIDEQGQVLVPKDRRTAEQRESFGHFDVMVRNMKRLLGTVPGGRSSAASAAAALALMRETHSPTGMSDVTFWAAYSVLLEDVRFQPLITEEDAGPTNTVGAIAGLDARHLPAEAQWGWPRKKKRKAEAFLVDPKMFRRAGAARRTMAYEDAFDGAIGWAIMEYAAADPSRSVTIANAATGEILHLRYGKGDAVICEAEEIAAETIAILTERLERRLSLIYALAETDLSEEEASAEALHEIEGTGSSAMTGALATTTAVKMGVAAYRWARDKYDQWRHGDVKKKQRDIGLRKKGLRKRPIRDASGTQHARITSGASGKRIKTAKHVQIEKPTVPVKPPRRRRKTPETAPALPAPQGKRRPKTATAETQPASVKPRRPAKPPAVPKPPKPTIAPSPVPSPDEKSKRQKKEKRDSIKDTGKFIGTAIGAMGKYEVEKAKEKGKRLVGKIKKVKERIRKPRQPLPVAA